jgi:hypothetical protein
MEKNKMKRKVKMIIKRKVSVKKGGVGERESVKKRRVRGKEKKKSRRV